MLTRIGRVMLQPFLGDLAGNSQVSQVSLMHYYRSLVRQSVRPLPTFDEVGFRSHSQFEEDGILLYIFSLIGVTNKIAVEICAGDGIECNTANLILNHGWQGYLFDGDKDNVKTGQHYYAVNKDTFLWPPKFTHAWMTAETINTIVQDAGVSGEIDLLSLDVDGNDYWLWKAIDCIRPRVLVCETQNSIGPEKAITIPYDPEFRITMDEYCGASLAAMAKLSAAKGYRLVGTHRYGFNAFFVRNGVGEDVLPAVEVADCLQHPSAEFSRRDCWPKVKDMPWVEV